jgi:lipid-A-disaccharide synthase-like uncharacterized protein
MYGSTEFLASCGGLLGLCLGMSVLSLLEIAYFCTIRLLSTRRGIDSSTNFQTPQKEQCNSRTTWWKMGKSLITVYSTRSTIQGLSYIADSNRPKIERLFWTVVFFISVFCCGSLIYNIFKRFDESPVIVTFSEQETPISQVPM